MDLSVDIEPEVQARLRKSDRRKLILLDLKLRPLVRISELAERFNVSTETIRRDVDALSRKGLVSRAHGGATAPTQGRYPGFDERNRDRMAERERIGRAAAKLVQPGNTIMIDSGATTLQFAQFLAFEGTACTVITNSLTAALTLGRSDAVEVIVCPGDLLASETAVVGTETVQFLERYEVDVCFIGASGLSENGPSEAIRSFAAIKRAMLQQSRCSHLLIDQEKFGRTSLVQFGALEAISSVVVDEAPQGALNDALRSAGVDILVAQ